MLANRGAPQSPAPRAAREGHLKGLLRFAFEATFQVDFLGAGAQHTLGGRRQQPLTGASSNAPARPRTEKSPSRNAESRLESVCSRNTTRSRTAIAKPNHSDTIRTVSVHWA